MKIKHVVRLVGIALFLASAARLQAAAMGDVIKTHYLKQVKTLVTKLKAIPEDGGTMFDNTTIICMPETGFGHHGPDTEAPMVIMSVIACRKRARLISSWFKQPFFSGKNHYN